MQQLNGCAENWGQSYRFETRSVMPDGGRPVALNWRCRTVGDGALLNCKTKQEDDMAKAKLRGNREAKKPKTDKPKGSGSAYKQAQSKSVASTTPFVRKAQLG